jgi:hypothetical protein
VGALSLPLPLKLVVSSPGPGPCPDDPGLVWTVWDGAAFTEDPSLQIICYTGGEVGRFNQNSSKPVVLHSSSIKMVNPRSFEYFSKLWKSISPRLNRRQTFV